MFKEVSVCVCVCVHVHARTLGFLQNTEFYSVNEDLVGRLHREMREVGIIGTG